MKITYKLIKQIHLYACLSTVSVLAMFIFTSYLMIHHDWFSHEPSKETLTVDLETIPASEPDWRTLIDQYGIGGRLIRENTNQAGALFREYAGAAGSTRITLLSDVQQAEIVRTTKTTADAIIGIHRQRGYGGPLQYNLYALLLDLIGVSLIVFTITGVIMWFKLLKNHKVAWIIFIGGFIYFSVTMAMLVYW